MASVLTPMGVPAAAEQMNPLEQMKQAAEMHRANLLAQAANKPPTPVAAGRVENKKQTAKTVGAAVSAVNSHFSNMFKAFQSIDKDNSGSIGRDELHVALKMWNVSLSAEEMDALWTRCDADNSGEIDYKEFVDTLARDTVAPAAMGKRDMQAKEAMGVADLDPEFLGHKKVKNYKVGEAVAGTSIMKVVNGLGDHFNIREALSMATNAVNSHFSNMFKAFQHMDRDGSGTIGTKELQSALREWNVGLDEAGTAELIKRCDADGNGQVSYAEFVDAFARDTVAPSAMGKQGQSVEDAMGVPDIPEEFFGRKKIKNFKMGE